MGRAVPLWKQLLSGKTLPAVQQHPLCCRITPVCSRLEHEEHGDGNQNGAVH